eukprot:463304_1
MAKAKDEEMKEEKKEDEDVDMEDVLDKPVQSLDEADIKLLAAYNEGPYTASLKKIEDEIKELAKEVDKLKGVKESDTGLAPPSQWDLVADKQMMQNEQPLTVARCTKIIAPNTEDAKYLINIKQPPKYGFQIWDQYTGPFLFMVFYVVFCCP